MRAGCRLLAEHGTDTAAILAAWDRLAASEPYSGVPLWLHGDLHPANILVVAGRVAGVVDFGDLTAGDPAGDFMVAWMIGADAASMAALRRAAEAHGGATWSRARAWALAWAVAALGASDDNPLVRRIARRTLAAAVRG